MVTVMEMDMPFVPIPRIIKRPREASVSITQKGRIKLNRAAAEQLKQMEAKYVRIGWDRESRLMEIKLEIKHSPFSPMAYPISHVEVEGNCGSVIHSRHVVDTVGLAGAATTTFPASWDEKGSRLIVDLSPGIRTR
jgi:hypothetical protein